MLPRDTQTRREGAHVSVLVRITDASSGIGKALAVASAREGNLLLLISRHLEPIAGLPESTVYRQADVADYGIVAAGQRSTVWSNAWSTTLYRLCKRHLQPLMP